MIPLLLLLAQPAVGDSPIRAETHVLSDAGAYRVGEPFRLVIEASHEPGAIAILPEELALGGALGERRVARKLSRRDADGKQIDRYELELIPFESGTIEVPAIPLALASTTASTKPLSIEVVSSLDESMQPVAASTLAEAMPELEKALAADPDPASISIPDYRPLALFGALAIAGLLAWAFARYRKRAEPEVTSPPAPARPAHEIALARLRALQQRPPAEQKAYYVELSEILRAYFGARYGFDSIELTVAELFAALEPLDTPGLDRVEARRLLDTADLVKFAKLVTEDAEAIAHGNDAVALVQATRARDPEVQP